MPRLLRCNLPSPVHSQKPLRLITPTDKKRTQKWLSEAERIQRNRGTCGTNTVQIERVLRTPHCTFIAHRFVPESWCIGHGSALRFTALPSFQHSTNHFPHRLGLGQSWRHVGMTWQNWRYGRRKVWWDDSTHAVTPLPSVAVCKAQTRSIHGWLRRHRSRNRPCSVKFVNGRILAWTLQISILYSLSSVVYTHFVPISIL